MLCCNRGGVVVIRCSRAASSWLLLSMWRSICCSAVRLRACSLLVCVFEVVPLCKTCSRVAHCERRVACCRSRFACLSVGVVVRAALSSSCACVSLYLCCWVVLVNLVRPWPMYFFVVSWLVLVKWKSVCSKVVHQSSQAELVSSCWM